MALVFRNGVLFDPQVLTYESIAKARVDLKEWMEKIKTQVEYKTCERCGTIATDVHPTITNNECGWTQWQYLCDECQQKLD
jgi:hypothetical protein